MNKKTLLIFLLILSVAIISIMLMRNAPDKKNQKNNYLIQELKPFFDPIFSEAANKKEAGIILAALLKKDIVNAYGIVDPLYKKEGYKNDATVTYKDRTFSQSDLELHTLAYMMDTFARDKDMLVLKGLDFAGGDIDQFEVADSDECLEACKKNLQCKAFTYARTTHPNLEKHNQCWLKDNRYHFIVNGNYISGLK